MSQVEQELGECGVEENPDPEDDADLPDHSSNPEPEDDTDLPRENSNPEPEDESNLPNPQPEDEMNQSDLNPEPEVNESDRNPNLEPEDEANQPDFSPNPEAEDEASLPNPEAEDEASLPNPEAEDEASLPNPVYEDNLPDLQSQERPEDEAALSLPLVGRERTEGNNDPQSAEVPLDSEKRKKKKKKKKKNSQKEQSDRMDHNCEASVGAGDVSSPSGAAEADLFEQDEALAAPECEAGLRDASCSESDQVLVSEDQAEPNELSNHVQIEQAKSSQSDNVVVENVEEQAEVGTDDPVAHQFNGDVEVVSSLEDAPEAEIGAGIVEACEEDANITEITDDLSVDRDNIQLSQDNVGEIGDNAPVCDEGANREENEQELPVPECDREVKNQQEFQEYLNENPEFRLDSEGDARSTENDEQRNGNSCDENSGNTAKVDSKSFQESNQASPASESVNGDSQNSQLVECFDHPLGNSHSESSLETPNNNSTDSKVISNGDISYASNKENLVQESSNPIDSNNTPAISETSENCTNSQNRRTSENVNATSPSDSVPDSNSIPQPQNGSANNTDVAESISTSQTSASSDIEGETYQRRLAEALRIHDDEEEELMTQLDAELLNQSSSSKEKDDSQDQKSSEVLNGMQPSSELQLNRQLLDQLQLRDAEIKRLTEESKANEEKLLALTSQETSDYNADDVYLPQIKELENTISQLQTEVKAGKEKLVSHDQAAKRAVTTLQNELKARVDQVTKQYEDTRYEKDMMVIRFAEAEAKTLEAQQKVEKWEKKVKDVLREKESMVAAVKAAKADRQKALSNHDSKTSEVKTLQKELEKQKEAVSSADYRIKWFQNKLKDELENHKSTKESLEKTTSKLKEAREETEMIRQDCQAIVKRYQESEEIKSNSLDKELKMKESELMMQKQERTDTEEIHQMTKRELDSIKSQHKDTLEEAKVHKDKVTCLEEERQQNHQMIERYQEIMQRQKSDNVDLRAKVATTTALEEQLARAQEMLSTLDKDVTELRTTKRDLQKDMDQYLERESKMLNLQSELSRSNALLRSENSSLSNKTSTLMGEVEKMKVEIQEHETRIKDLSNKYENEKTIRKEEVEKMSATLTECTKESADYRQKWEDEVDSCKTLKRRHANNIKDLTRQLQQVRRRMEAMDGKGEGSMGSRTNSNVSLNSIDTPSTSHHTSSHHTSSHHTSQAPPPPQPVIQEYPVITEQVEVDKQVLIERIVRLQKSHARKNEKLEFLGEHIQQLLTEIRRKNKVIQSYVVREEAGTLSSEVMDANKECHNKLYKAQVQSEIQSLLAGKGGIMASMYSQHQQDGHMTLELSLQINGKLQAVLEDTLLKNITLKENFDTLGEEIARLSQENRKLQLRLRELENPGSTS